MKFSVRGLYPALLTPFDKNGKVMYDRACQLAERLVKQGVAGIFACGTTGEGPLLTLDERKKMAEELVAAVGKRTTVIMHTGCFDTASTIELTCHAAKAGAGAAGVVAPGFFAYDDGALGQHYKAVAKAAAGFPIFLYNLPSCARNVLSPDLILRLAHDVDNMVGLKDSAGSIQNLTRVLDHMPAGFSVLNGVDEYTFEAVVSGAVGSVTSTGNAAPELFINVHKAVWAGQIQKARAAQKKLNDACNLFQYGRMVAFYKEGLRLRGFDAGYVRAPQRELTTAEKKKFAADMAALGLI